jgi:3-dehydroquinate dehydratase-2
MRILVINGPNLNLLGRRQPEVYGRETLADIELLMRNHADALRVELKFVQSNHEGDIVDAIQEHLDWDGMILNAGAYTHTSLAIADAIASVQVPTVEVHLSNIYARERIRHRSLVAPVVWGQISGLGYRGYLAALDALQRRLTDEPGGPA